MYKPTKHHRLIALGGTFDHFHQGHASFLKYAFEHGKELLIGVTSPKLTQHKPFSHTIESLKTRTKAVQKFCQENKIKHRIIILEDPYGPTIDKENRRIDALCVTQETLGGADKINEIRQVMRMKELPIYVAPFELAQNGKPIHAINIRAGQINRQGLVYAQSFTQDLELNQAQRQFFKKPLGSFVETPIQNYNQENQVFVVGDTALERFIKNEWAYDCGIYDQKTQRQPINSAVINQLKPDLVIDNPAGLLTSKLITKLEKFLRENKNSKQHVFINGEEDLVTVALVLLLPLESDIYYGQPNQGLVHLKISEGLKNKVWSILTDR